MDLGFSGNTMAEGLSGEYVLGWRIHWLHVQQLDCRWDWEAEGFPAERCAYDRWTLFEIIATSTTLNGMLIGRFLVGIGMGVGPPVASLYVTEVSPTSVRGTYGSFIQIATCLGILGALFFGTLVNVFYY